MLVIGAPAHAVDIPFDPLPIPVDRTIGGRSLATLPLSADSLGPLYRRYARVVSAGKGNYRRKSGNLVPDDTLDAVQWVP